RRPPRCWKPRRRPPPRSPRASRSASHLLYGRNESRSPSTPRAKTATIEAVRFASALLMPIAVVAAACGSSTHARPQPAERHLVYVAGETAAKANVWIADVNGAHPRKLGHGSIAVLSPDGRTVALSRPDGIHLVSSSGKSDRRLTARHLQPRAWSSDGETLIATRSTPNAVVSLVAIERRSGRVRVIARGSLYGVDVSPKGDELVYSRAPEVTPDGICGDQFDLYVSKVDGGSPSRLTHDGLSAFPVWGSSGIAYSHFHTGGVEDCWAAGLRTIDSDG